MPSQLVGEFAAVMGSLLWSFCSIFFVFSSRRVGTYNVNALRILMAVGLLSFAHIVVLGSIMPQANRTQWLVLGISGFIGLALGDLMYFGCLVTLGPRKGVLVMATNPIFSVIAGYFLLGQVLGWWAIAGISITLAGVTWVILEKDEQGTEEPLGRKAKLYGVALGIGGAVGQGVGLVLSQYGMKNAASNPVDALNPLSATLIRVVIAGISFMIILAVMGRLPGLTKATRDRKAVSAMFGGALLGPFLGVWLSMIAVSNTPAGVAATLLSLMPVMIIPIVWVIYRQKTSWRGVIGAMVAIAGVAILFLT
jgi:drug/metabolite transporter (DMT)-like permease